MEFNRSHKGKGKAVAEVEQNVQPQVGGASVGQGDRMSKYWTKCDKCNATFRYPRLYLDITLLCANCYEAFKAIEMHPPPDVLMPDQNLREKVGGTYSKDRSNYQFSGATGVGWTFPHSFGLKAASVVEQASERAKRELNLQDKKVNSPSLSDVLWKRAGASQAGGASYGSAFGSRMHGFLSPYGKPNYQQISLPELKKYMRDKIKADLRKALDKWNLEAAQEERLKASKRRNVMVEDQKSVEPMSMDVPDPDFHNFDLARIEESFADGQIWAVYDDDDGMPRLYARINEVISLNPFKMKISWLNSRSTRELGPIDWIGSGFYKTCGDFRTGKHVITEALNSFSHIMNWTKGTRRSVCIYPSKGDVWALYRNWSPDWNHTTPDEVIHKYDMVEVLDTDNEGAVSVIPLVKVVGFRSVFHRSMNLEEVRIYPKEEMFRFSHQVPAYLLTGHEAPNAPGGCLELDPAATPIELLQEVVNEAEYPYVGGIPNDCLGRKKENADSDMQGKDDEEEMVLA